MGEVDQLARRWKDSRGMYDCLSNAVIEVIMSNLEQARARSSNWV